MNHTLVVDIKGLCKAFEGKPAVCGVDFQINKGEILGFLGPNGSGKTTSMRMICGLLQPDAGSGHCLGYDIRKDTLEIKKRVGYMTQSFSLYHDLTVYENLEFIARIYEMTNVKTAIQDVLDRLGFESHTRHQLAGKLSGGWKQRLALAAAILHQPGLLLLDEPTSGVDPQARRDFWDAIHNLSEQGVTILLSTHYLDETEHCHRITYIVDGQLLATGLVSDIIRQSGLSLWVVTGEDVTSLARELRLNPAVNQAAVFGTKLHVVGTDPQELEKAIEPYRHAYHWQQELPSIEDIFLYLVMKSRQRVQS